METLSKGKIVIITFQQSVILRGMEGNMHAIGYETEVLADVHEDIGKYSDRSTLFMLYVSDDIFSETHKLRTVSSITTDIHKQGKKMIVIGEEAHRQKLLEMLPEINNYNWFDRPIDMEKLTSAVKKLFASMQSTQKKKILIVDDDPSYARMVRAWIEDKYNANIVTMGLQAVSFLTKNKVDLVLLDYEMPVFDGARTLRMIRTNPEIKDTPIVFLTGNNTKEGIMSIIELEPTGYILKTATRDELMARIESIFDKIV